MLTTIVLASQIASPDKLVEWRAPPDCPAAEALSERIDDLLQVDRDTLELPVRYAVEVSEADPTPDSRDGGFVARVTTSVGSQRRTKELRSRHCVTIMEAVAVEIALSVEARLFDPEAPLVSIEPRSLDAAVSAPPESPDPTPPRREEAENGTLDVMLTGGVEVFPLPVPAGVVGLGVRGGAGRWRVGARVDYGVYRVVRYDPDADASDAAGGRFHAAAGAIEGCIVGRIASRVQLPLCGGVRGGWVSGEGFGVPSPQRSGRPFVEAEFGPDVLFRPTRSSLIPLSVRGKVGVLRPRFGTPSLGTLFTAPWAGFSLRLGLGLRAK